VAERTARNLVLLLFAAALFPVATSAQLDLSAASAARLENGLTVIVLEDSTFPVVSVQMLYRSGAADEETGKTGLAHFLEHMAFRDTANFPDTEVVSSIYAVGGEWHGYTWLDQTTYYATVPSAELGLLLRVEADRMARLEIPADKVEAESGAILAEMHGYENDPASVLRDYVLYVSFLAHPYRNNTIGWESDVANLSHDDLVDFYRRHYQPGNAVLAVVGDVRKEEVMSGVRALFSEIPAGPTPEQRYTPEPAQTGERRIVLHGDLDRKYFSIAYRAPAVSSPDYAAFLLAQELLSAGSGVSFLQNDWGTPARDGSPFSGISGDVTTWFPPSKQDYVFMISGSIPSGGDTDRTEAEIDRGIDTLRELLRGESAAGNDAVDQARARVMRELVFDVQTTEDAAHQLAFFAGLGALDVLTDLPAALQRVSSTDIERVLDRYLAKEHRTVGWFIPGNRETPEQARQVVAKEDMSPPQHMSERKLETAEPAGPAIAGRLANGTPVIIQRSVASHTVTLRVVAPRAEYRLPAGVETAQPAWGLISLDFDILPHELDTAIIDARAALESATPAPAVDEIDAGDPESLLEHYRQNLLGLEYPADTGGLGPLLLVVSGDIDPARVMQQLESGFGHLQEGKWSLPDPSGVLSPVQVEAAVLYPVAQERIGYLVRVPAPRPRAAAAWQMALYILSHGYEGRLGKEAISRRGLVYYIDSAYRTDGRNDWITLETGVDPSRLPEMVALLKQELSRLIAEPPAEQEIAEARAHLLGRYVSAAQSNGELADRLTRQWIWYGGLLSYEEWERQLAAVGRQDILDLLPEFTSGSILVVRNPAKPE